MKPPVFSYQDPQTLPEALDALGEHGDDARVPAGGQSLLPLLTMRLVRPRVVDDVETVEGLAPDEPAGRGKVRRPLPGGVRGRAR